MAWMYAPIWEELKRTGRADVTVSEANLATVKQAIKKVKAHENVTRRPMGLAPFGKLEFSQTLLSKDRKLWKLSVVLTVNPKLL